MSTDIIALPVGNDPLQGDIVPMSTGIRSMSVDIDSLSVNSDRPGGGSDP
jgi:hypothetical protein